MNSSKFVVVDDSLLGKIDGNRGEKTRSEFVNSCVRRLLRDLEPEVNVPADRPASIGAWVTRSEFDQFRQRMDQVNQEFMDFFIKYASRVAAEKRPEADTEDFAVELRRLLML